MKRLTAALLVCLLLASAAPALAATPEAVEQTIRALGIITGDENGNMNLDEPVTRAQFAKMMVSASALRDSVGPSGTGSPFSDLKATHWAAEYIKAAVQAGWMVGYVDGTFRPDGSIKVEEAATAVLRMLGFTSADLTGVYPAPQLAKYSALGLSQGISAGQGQTMTRRDCMYLFYNMMTAQTAQGKVYATTIGYAVTAAGEIDYSSLVQTQLKGPFIAQSTSLSSVVPFEPAEVYRAGSLTDSRAVELYDVVYYHEVLRTVWVYTERAAGLYTAYAPNADSPSSVTVGGIAYQVGTSSAAYKLSSMGQYSTGDSVTLLLGRSGEIVDVLGGNMASAVYYGVAAGKREVSYTTSAGTQKSEVALVACTDGVTREFPLDAGLIAEGYPVRVTVESGRTKIERASSPKSLSGTVNSSATKLGDVSFAGNIEIIDADVNANTLTLFPARLSGYKLSADDIRFYALNEKGEISHMILRDATGDMATYGVITSVLETETPKMGTEKVTVIDPGTGATSVVDQTTVVGYTYSASYGYIIDGVPGSYSTDTFMHLSKGAAQIQLDGKALAKVSKLSGLNVTELSQTHVTAGGRRIALADSVQVYLFESSVYTLTALGEVDNLDEYTLTCYFDSFSAGARARVIIAVPR